MRILISGSTGFIGSHVTRLLSKNHTVGILLRNLSNTYRLSDCLDRVVQLPVQFEDQINLELVLSKFNPDIVLHLGWDGVSKSARDSYDQINNINLSLNFLLAAIRSEVKAFIGLGSQAEYAPSAEIISEASPTKPSTLYGAAKLATYTMAERVAADARIRFVWARVFSVYGPSDHPDTLISYLIDQLLAGERPILGTGDQRWDYLYVEDAAEAISLLATSDLAEGVFNIASGNSRPLRECIEIIRDMIDITLPLGIGELPVLSNRIIDLEANVDRLRDVVGWAPATQFIDGISATLDWHRSQKRNYSYA